MSQGLGKKGRPKVFYVLGTIVLGGALYLAFELGRFQSGYSLLDERHERIQAAAALAEREATIEDLRRQLAVFETSREIDRETYDQVEANLSDLQAKIQAQEEELAFYRGIVSPQDGLSGLRIQNVEVVPTASEQRYLVRLVLVQAIIHNQRVTGIVKLRVAGEQDGAAVTLDLADLAADGDGDDIAYQFRYFEGFERELNLPVGFEPSSIEVEIWPHEPRGETVKQSFPWSVVSG
jgi:Family of unknown function (DUF6776)